MFITQSPTTSPVRSLGLIGCSARKALAAASARRLYRGRIFQAALPYSELHHDATLILSAHHGLVHPDQELEPYDCKLSSLARAVQRRWAEGVLADLLSWQALHAPDLEVVVCYAGQTYWRDLADQVRSAGIRFETPLAGIQGVQAHSAWFAARLSRPSSGKPGSPQYAQPRLF